MGARNYKLGVKKQTDPPNLVSIADINVHQCHDSKAHAERKELRESSRFLASILMPTSFLTRQHLAQRHIEQRSCCNSLQDGQHYRIFHRLQVDEAHADENARHTAR